MYIHKLCTHSLRLILGRHTDSYTLHATRVTRHRRSTHTHPESLRHIQTGTHTSRVSQTQTDTDVQTHIQCHTDKSMYISVKMVHSQLHSLRVNFRTCGRLNVACHSQMTYKEMQNLCGNGCIVCILKTISDSLYGLSPSGRC